VTVASDILPAQEGIRALRRTFGATFSETGEPIDAEAPPVPAEYFGDPGHAPSCPAATLAID